MSKLYVDSVQKSFGTKQVLTDIFLTCSIGEIVGLIGRNGCGKSTLLKIVFGSLGSENKFVKVDEEIINSLYQSRNLVKYLPQNHFLPNHIKIKTIISLFCNYENAIIISENPLVKPFLNKKCNQLSGGEKRIVEVLLIIYSNAKFILIDEPFNGISPIFREEIKKLIVEISKTKGFIITDHDYRNIIEIATRTIVMQDGGIKKVNSNDDLVRWGYLSNNLT
jgi:ABC-type multidrug transport system ATPase subunit